MQNLTRINMVVIKEYEHTKTVDENVKWMKPTHLLSIFSQTLGPPFVHLPILHKI